MVIKKTVKVTIVFLIIFILGAVTGASLMPVIFNKVEGNPYSINVLAERVYNTHLLKNAGLTPDQKKAVKMLSANYVLKYTAERDMFMAKRSTLYNEFKFDLEKILTMEQYENFASKSDDLINQRINYSKALEAKWKAESDKKSQERLASIGYDKTLKSISLDVPAVEIVPTDLQNADNRDKKSFDFLNRYMIDRVKYKWGTYTVYHEMYMGSQEQLLDDIEP